MENSLTPRPGTLDSRRVEFEWEEIPADDRPGRVVIGTRSLTRRYEARLTEAGIDLEWADGRDNRCHSVWREWDGTWRCSCPDFPRRQSGLCKHVQTVAYLFDREGW